MLYILRREGTGLTGLKEILGYLKNPAQIVLSTRQENAQAQAGDTVLKWGTTATMQGAAVAKVLNKSPAIQMAANKRDARMLMQREGVPVPKSFLTVKDMIASMPTPNNRFVLRPFKHSKGHYMRVGNAAEITIHSKKRAYKDGYISQFIDKVKEYRVFVVSGKVAAVAIKIPENADVAAWNHAAGAVFDNLRWDAWPLKACEAAIKATKIVGLDFGAVDVIEDAQGNPYVLEVNTAPAVDSEYRQQCIAKTIDYIIENNSDWMETGDVTGWRDVIHPAIWTKGRKKGAQARAAE